MNNDYINPTNDERAIPSFLNESPRKKIRNYHYFIYIFFFFINTHFP